MVVGITLLTFCLESIILIGANFFSQRNMLPNDGYNLRGYVEFLSNESRIIFKLLELAMLS